MKIFRIFFPSQNVDEADQDSDYGSDFGSDEEDEEKIFDCISRY